MATAFGLLTIALNGDVGQQGIGQAYQVQVGNWTILNISAISFRSGSVIISISKRLPCFIERSLIVLYYPTKKSINLSN